MDLLKGSLCADSGGTALPFVAAGGCVLAAVHKWPQPLSYGPDADMAGGDTDNKNKQRKYSSREPSGCGQVFDTIKGMLKKTPDFGRAFAAFASKDSQGSDMRNSTRRYGRMRRIRTGAAPRKIREEMTSLRNELIQLKNAASPSHTKSIPHIQTNEEIHMVNKWEAAMGIRGIDWYFDADNRVDWESDQSPGFSYTREAPDDDPRLTSSSIRQSGNKKGSDAKVERSSSSIDDPTSRASLATAPISSTTPSISNILNGTNTVSVSAVVNDPTTTDSGRQPITLRDHRKFMRQYLHADIDLFITTRNADEAFDAIVELCRRIQQRLQDDQSIVFMRTNQSITMLLPKPYPKIQIILRLYSSIEHVLLGFDIDCCCLAYDGKQTLAMPRAIRALETRRNLVDPTRQSLTYEQRLLKYAKRGFDVALQKLTTCDILDVARLVVTTIKDGIYTKLSGMQLLLSLFYASVNKENKLIAKVVGNVSKYTSDYGPATTSSENIFWQIVESNHNPEKLGSKPQFASGSNILRVLQTPDCVAPDLIKSTNDRVAMYRRNGTAQMSCIGNVSSRVMFQVKTPHVQDRVDLLYTGAFNPLMFDWYGSTGLVKPVSVVTVETGVH